MKKLLPLLGLLCMSLLSNAQSTSASCGEVLTLVDDWPKPNSCKNLTSRDKLKQCLSDELEAYVHSSLTLPADTKTRVRSMGNDAYPVQVVINTNGKAHEVKPVGETPAFLAEGIQKALQDMPAMEPGKLNGTARCVGVEVSIYPNRAIFDPTLSADAFPAVEKGTPPSMPKRIVEGIFKVVEEMPRVYDAQCESLPKSERKECADKVMLERIQDNLVYPAEAKANGVEGVVVVQFVVETNGKIDDIRVVRGPGSGTGEEAERIVREHFSDGWLPGKQRGKKVRVQFNLPVKFRLDDQEEAEEQPDLEPVYGEVFKVVQEMPRYFSGSCEELPKHQRKDCANEAMLARIYDHMRYPEEALQQGKQDVAVVQFIVSPDGKITSIKVVRDPGFGMGAEAERLVREHLSTKWVPGKQGGRPVPVQFNLPVKFER
jgi:TonB family protein